MTNEFIFGTLEKASAYAKSQGWKPAGRGEWEKPDGTCVHLLAFLEQFAALHRGQRVYALRKLDALEARTLKNLGAEIVNI
jgi:hypothetical protein